MLDKQCWKQYERKNKTQVMARTLLFYIHPHAMKNLRRQCYNTNDVFVKSSVIILTVNCNVLEKTKCSEASLLLLARLLLPTLIFS
jgi:hypothetical protein